MDINTRWVQFKGKAEIPYDLDTNKNLVLAGEFEVKDWKHSPNQDGTEDISYTIYPIELMQQKEGGESIRLKAGEKRHIKQYRAIYHYWNEHKPTEDFESFYDSLEAFINSSIPEIVELRKETHSHG